VFPIELRRFRITYPPLEALSEPQEFGYCEPTEEEKRIADQVLKGAPSAPRPIDIAKSLVDRYFRSHPKWISQFPAPKSWNPIIVEFFTKTGTPQNNDMTPWCAAFANWCIERANRNGIFDRRR
jgi:hypothetical protein